MRKIAELLALALISIGIDESVADKFEKIFSENNEVLESRIVEDLGVEPASARRILFKLQYENIMRYRKVTNAESDRNSEVYWTLNKEGILKLVRKRVKMMKQNLQKRLEYETSEIIYECANEPTHARMPISDAMAQNFICPECGASLIQTAKENIVENLSKLIEFLDNILSDLEK